MHARGLSSSFMKSCSIWDWVEAFFNYISSGVAPINKDVQIKHLDPETKEKRQCLSYSEVRNATQWKLQNKLERVYSQVESTTSTQIDSNINNGPASDGLFAAGDAITSASLQSKEATFDIDIPDRHIGKSADILRMSPKVIETQTDDNEVKRSKNHQAILKRNDSNDFAAGDNGAQRLNKSDKRAKFKSTGGLHNFILEGADLFCWDFAKAMATLTDQQRSQLGWAKYKRKDNTPNLLKYNRAMAKCPRIWTCENVDGELKLDFGDITDSFKMYRKRCLEICYCVQTEKLKDDDGQMQVEEGESNSSSLGTIGLTAVNKPAPDQVVPGGIAASGGGGSQDSYALAPDTAEPFFLYDQWSGWNSPSDSIGIGHDLSGGKGVSGPLPDLLALSGFLLARKGYDPISGASKSNSNRWPLDGLGYGAGLLGIAKRQLQDDADVCWRWHEVIDELRGSMKCVDLSESNQEVYKCKAGPIKRPQGTKRDAQARKKRKGRKKRSKGGKKHKN